MKGEKKLDLPKVQLTQISISGVYPHVWLTFSEGNIGVTQESDPANERSCLSQAQNRFKNIGCGGEKMRNLALNSHTDIIILVYMYIGIIWRTK